jgi:hypothetical protein
MVSPHIASTLRLRNVSRGSRLRCDTFRRLAPSRGTTWSGTARVTVCPIIGTACNSVHTPAAISVGRSPATPPSTLPTTGPVIKPRLNPSRTVDITRLSAPVGAWVSWSRTAAKISEPVAPANPITVRLTTNAIQTSVLNAITTHPTRPTTAPTRYSDSRSVSRSDQLPTTNPRTGAARLVRKNNPASGSDAPSSCTKNSDSWGMATEIPRPPKNRLTVAHRYSRDPSTKPSVELDLVVTACSGIRPP